MNTPLPFPRFGRCFTVAALVLAMPLSAWAIATDAEAINKAGRQRMLSQRIAMSYFMIGLNANAAEAQQRIDGAVAEFHSNLMELRDYARDPAVQVALDKEAQIWGAYSALVVAKPNPNQGLQVLAQSDQLLAACEDVVQKLGVKPGAGSARLVAVSGRQRMLSQKLGKYYLAMAWKLPAVGLEANFNQTLQDFDGNLQQLAANADNTPAINTALNRVRNDWGLSKSVFTQYKDGRFAPLIVVTTSESILKQMDAVTGLYVALASGKTPAVGRK